MERMFVGTSRAGVQWWARPEHFERQRQRFVGANHHPTIEILPDGREVPRVGVEVRYLRPDCLLTWGVVLENRGSLVEVRTADKIAYMGASRLQWDRRGF